MLSVYIKTFIIHLFDHLFKYYLHKQSGTIIFVPQSAVSKATLVLLVKYASHDK